MKDETIKDLLRGEDGPSKSPNEWNQILRKIEKAEGKKTSPFDFRIFWGLLASTIAVISIYSLGSFNQNLSVAVDENEDLNSYFMENTYIDDEQDLYAWADF